MASQAERNVHDIYGRHRGRDQELMQKILKNRDDRIRAERERRCKEALERRQAQS